VACDMSLGGVILAAGESSRMGRDKALLPWPPDKDGTLLSASIRALSDHCDLVLVVTGRNQAALEPVIYGCGAFVIGNPNPERGQFSSLQIGLQGLLSRGRDSAMVTLVDRPPPSAGTLALLLKRFCAREHGIWAVVPEYQGKHGHPVLIGREMIEAFLKAPSTASARDIEHAHQHHLCYVQTEDAMVAANLNTPADYLSLESRKLDLT
jgi:molybdenum cofactor cytidylyltransferase